jgi:hypothetical protein
MHWSCAVLGHQVDNHVLQRSGPARYCKCGEPYLRDDGSITRVRHTLSCFLGHHTYRPLTDRDGCREYVCVQCGHPLVYTERNDPYRAASIFTKKVRYLCGLFGHRVRAVTTRAGRVEYACHCGHSFLMPESGLRKIRHPLVCVFLGHFIRHVTARAGYDEFLCVNCGHPFCFARGGEAAARSGENAKWAMQNAKRLAGVPSR